MADFEIVDPRFRALVLPNAPLETLATGFRWLEGPVWFADRDELLFSDIPNNRVLRWCEGGGVSVFREPSDFENGHTRDREGRLVSCSHHGRRVTRSELDGTVTVLAERHDGKRLNSPNDVVVKSDGGVWFTDPPYGIQTDYEGGKQHAELPANVYCLDPASGRLRVVADDFEGPNGLCFSPDETRLYVAETGLQFAAGPRQQIRVFEVEKGSDGVNRLANGRCFLGRHADGMRCDERGNLWIASDDGVHCFDPQGTLLGRIRVPSPVSNLCFGGRNRCRLFLCASQTLFAIYTNTRGAQRP
ncbi:MAG TPA: SMP-30/gluconolactonase/LRE family protein [Frateuria sp.]|uniref:SMP-30/gluconolactonase/LRE family protein n=1 Tax=Frateuria sp. TaxID=2211372 RepID=UPI002DF69691|nr:SMP-30/gluconolactonase/LRE family protein [Frateuria sp.]